jgi:hypothetical protein
VFKIQSILVTLWDTIFSEMEEYLQQYEISLTNIAHRAMLACVIG